MNIKIKIYLLAIIFSSVSFINIASASQITVKNVIDLVNKERIRKNLPPLVENESLSKSAQAKANDMIKNNYFAHTSPEGLTPWHWIDSAGYDYKFAGENLAINFNSAEKQNNALMNSATHRKNILGEQFNEIGVAVQKGIINGREAIVTVQQFGNRGIEIVLSENEYEKKQKKEFFVENNRAILISSAVGFFGNDSMKNSGKNISILKNETNSFFKKVLNVIRKDSVLFSKEAMISISVLVFLGGFFEILRRFHDINNYKGEWESFSAKIIKEKNYFIRKIFFELENVRILYLPQIKQRE